MGTAVPSTISLVDVSADGVRRALKHTVCNVIGIEVTVPPKIAMSKVAIETACLVNILFEAIARPLKHLDGRDSSIV